MSWLPTPLYHQEPVPWADGSSGGRRGHVVPVLAHTHCSLPFSRQRQLGPPAERGGAGLLTVTPQDLGTNFRPTWGVGRAYGI